MKSSHGLMHLVESGILLEVCQILFCKSGHARGCKEKEKFSIYLSDPSGADLQVAHYFWQYASKSGH